MAGRLIPALTGRYVFRSLPGKGADFLNALNAGGVGFHGASADGDTVTVSVSVFGYRAAVRAAGELGEVCAAYGLPFIIYKYRKRAGLVAGTALGLFMMFVSSLFAWEINVTGNGSVSDAAILCALERMGVYVGAFIPDIDVSGVNGRLVCELPELSSANLHIDGTSLCVDVIERVRPPVKIDVSGVYDVIAAEDGVVRSLEIYSGRAAVAVGDTVVKGQVLVNGVYTAGEDPSVDIATHARAAVRAEYIKSFVYSVPLDFAERRYTGRTDEKTVIYVLGRPYKLFMGEPYVYEHFDAAAVTESVSVFSLKLPVTKTTLRVSEYVYDVRRIGVEEAREKALRAFDAWCANDTEGRITDKRFKTEYDLAADCVTIYGEVTLEGDIACERRSDVP